MRATRAERSKRIRMHHTRHAPTMSSLRALVAILPLFSFVAAQEASDTPPPRVGGPLGYIPNKAAALIFFALYALVAVNGTWLIFRTRGQYMATLVISGYIYALGLILRLPFSSHTDSLGMYIFMNLCTVLSPCGLIATVYVLLGRLALHLEAEDLLLVRPNIITKLYVTSDIVTLLVQASGGSLAAFNDVNLAKISTKIFLAGLILQLISFASYMVVFSVFIYRFKSLHARQWNAASEKGKRRHWKGLVVAMAICCLGITIRCVYRTIEGAQGFDGYLLTHEVYFYVLDCLPLFCAVVVYSFVWPPSILVETYRTVAHELVNKNSSGSV